MKLTLDHTQRLNLHALLVAQRADVGSIRAIWAIQDRIALDADEEKAIGLKREMVAGQERVAWNPALSIPAKEFEFTDSEAARIKVALEAWESYGVSADRRLAPTACRGAVCPRSQRGQMTLAIAADRISRWECGWRSQNADFPTSGAMDQTGV